MLTPESLLSVLPTFWILKAFHILALGTRSFHSLLWYNRSPSLGSSMSPYQQDSKSLFLDQFFPFHTFI